MKKGRIHECTGKMENGNHDKSQIHRYIIRFLFVDRRKICPEKMRTGSHT